MNDLAMKLNLQRPLIIFDLETTGTDPVTDYIVEIAWIKIWPDGETSTFESKINPGIPIPPSAFAVHGIKDEDVAGCPQFSDIADEVYAEFKDCELCGHNIKNFDVPLLDAEFHRAGIVDWFPGGIVDTYAIFKAFFDHSLGSAHEVYCGEPMKDAHEAMADVLAVSHVISAMIDRHGLDANPAEIAKKPIDPTWVDSDGKFKFVDGGATFTFGKFSGGTLRYVVANDKGFLNWMLSKDFSEEVKPIVRDALNGVYPDEEM